MIALTNGSGRATDSDETQNYLRVARFPRQQHREGVVMVVIMEEHREAGNEVPIWWSLLRLPLLPAPYAAPTKKKKERELQLLHPSSLHSVLYDHATCDLGKT